MTEGALTSSIFCSGILISEALAGSMISSFSGSTDFSMGSTFSYISFSGSSFFSTPDLGVGRKVSITI